MFEALKTKLSTGFFKNRPPYKGFLFLIGFWLVSSMVVVSLYDPITEISPVWWLFNFLVVDGMVVCLFIPYRNIFKILLWYVYLSMIFATFILSLIIVRVIISYMNGELSALYLYENAMLEPLLGLIQELANLVNPPTNCGPGEGVRAAASTTTNVAARANSTAPVIQWQDIVLKGILNGAALSSAAVAVGSANPRVKVYGVTAFAIGVAATYMATGSPPPTNL
jgi:hypothetical protein